MPCAAPCNRLPCSRRCPKKLDCGHQCPSICGESCPQQYCQICSKKQEQRVDILEFTTFGEVDLDSAPVVVLSCGHFFTIETLDGLVGMNEVYTTNGQGEFVGLEDISWTFTSSIPRCPDCKSAIRQYATKRYNRIVNRAVIDEMSKRFLVNGQKRLQGLEKKVTLLESVSEKSRQELISRTNKPGTHTSPIKSVQIIEDLKSRNESFKKLNREIASFLSSVSDNNQPIQKLHNATLKAIRAKKTVQEQMKQLTTKDVPQISRDQRVIFGGGITQLKLHSVILADKFEIIRGVERVHYESASVTTLKQSISDLVAPFFKVCQQIIADCGIANLPKFNVEARLYYGRIARLYQWYSSTIHIDTHKAAAAYVKSAKQLLEEAKTLCSHQFQNANILRKGVEETLNLLGKEWYETITPTELLAIKAAMVTGPQGLNTHSGHWYNCANGHPVSFTN